MNKNNSVIAAKLVSCLLLFLIFYQNANAHSDRLNPRALPLGDGKISTEPRLGYLYACSNSSRGGGAKNTGNWIHGNTWDQTQKISVQGNVDWPSAALNIALFGEQRKITGNGLPIDHNTGIFPIQPNDPAFLFDTNPNSISAQQLDFSISGSPERLTTPGCVPMGVIGVSIDGVAFFNALDAESRDAVAHEVQDHCGGHPEKNGRYHYHGPTTCIAAASENNALLGYALDGFGIYSSYDENGIELTNADLDECHGRVSQINWDGKIVNMYHYVLTREYPYTVGCFRGKPIQVERRTYDSHAQGDQQRHKPDGRDSEAGLGQRHPPPIAISACAGKSSHSRCEFISPRGDRIEGSCQSLEGDIACVPERR